MPRCRKCGNTKRFYGHWKACQSGTLVYDEGADAPTEISDDGYGTYDDIIIEECCDCGSYDIDKSPSVS